MLRIFKTKFISNFTNRLVYVCLKDYLKNVQLFNNDIFTQPNIPR